MLALAQGACLEPPAFAAAPFSRGDRHVGKPTLQVGHYPSPGHHSSPKKMSEDTSAQLLTRETLGHCKFHRGLNQISGRYGGEAWGA
jgi:hypothetical protein